MTTFDNKYALQLAEKKQRLTDLLLPFTQQNLEVFESPPQNYRMRAEFRIWHEGERSFHIMFDKESKSKYEVEYLPAACQLINDAMKDTIALVCEQPLLRAKLFQIDYLASTTNELVISLIYHKQLDSSWEDAAQALKQALSHLGTINIIGRAKKQKVVIGEDYVIEKLRLEAQETAKDYIFKQVENSFTQPNANINVKMLNWTLGRLRGSEGDLLELYCGAGNFSIPLASIFRRVFATEISKSSVNAAQYNIDANAVSNVVIARLSSEEFTEAYKGARAFFRLKDIELHNYQFSTVLVDPPRAGLDADTLKLISQFKRIVYISCNPNTLANNLVTLSETHHVEHAALFDQFPFTEHIETGVVLKKR
ncbi:tRNA (uridine(54)-C5)-methyltransferase TrmA [Glaciecola siphonariae]|uniref:tRNA/tmRNA (uracil-C(5))-methyltransferase n=1 Tax=Glaciecola siphonariae TaxID=521012 RepID=A0ABV9M0N7_9ALTE